MTPIFFIVIAIVLGVMHCLKPAGTESLLATDDWEMIDNYSNYNITECSGAAQD